MPVMSIRESLQPLEFNGASNSFKKNFSGNYQKLRIKSYHLPLFKTFKVWPRWVFCCKATGRIAFWQMSGQICLSILDQNLKFKILWVSASWTFKLQFHLKVAKGSATVTEVQRRAYQQRSSNRVTQLSHLINVDLCWKCWNSTVPTLSLDSINWFREGAIERKLQKAFCNRISVSCFYSIACGSIEQSPTGTRLISVVV